MAPLILSFLLFLIPLSQAANTTCPAVDKCLAGLTRGSDCPNVLPVPLRSRIPRVPRNSFSLRPLRRGVFVYSDGDYLSLILRRGRRIVLLDVLGSPRSTTPTGGTVLVDAAKQVLNGTVPWRIDIVYSHAHYDHIGGARSFVTWAKSAYPRAKLLVWGTARAREVVALSTTKRAVPPNVLVGRKGAVLHLGKGLRVEMHVLGGHTPDDLALYIPPYRGEQGILMHVDVVFPRWSPPFNFAVSRDIGRYITVTRELLRFDFDTFVCGHNVLGSRADVEEAGRFVQSVLAAAQRAERGVDRKALADGFSKIFDPTAVEFGNVWFGFARVLREPQIDICYREIVEKWGCRLAGVDIFGRGLCFSMLQYLLLEF